MSERDEYLRLLARIGQAMTASDPCQSFAEAAAEPVWSEPYRQALSHASAEGVRLSALLVAKLRFEALINSSAHAASTFAEDPQGFTDLFRRYHVAVAPSHRLPSEDARRFEAWVAALASKPLS